MIIFFEILGSLGLFLFGMRTMSNGLQKAAGNRLQAAINYMTGKYFTAVLTGGLLTLLIQSSSGTTVMVVSFVEASLLSLTQAIGVIMGANIGTTFTGWLVTATNVEVNMSAFALPVVGIGALLFFIRKFQKTFYGEAIIGFGIIFLGLTYLKDAVPNIADYPSLLKYFATIQDFGFLSVLIFVIIGTIITIIMQSSSATMAITLTAAVSGWINYPSAAAMILGENIGTTLTANVAAIGGSVTAKRAAIAHLIFNLIGVTWVLILFAPMLGFINFLIPGSPYSEGSLSITLPAHLAMFHTVFNVANTMLCIGFLPQLKNLVERLIKAKEVEKTEGMKSYDVPIVEEYIHSSPEVYLVELRNEIAKMSDISKRMFERLSPIFEGNQDENKNIIDSLEKEEMYIDDMRDKLTHFLSKFSIDILSERAANDITAMLRVLNELESISDSSYKLGCLGHKRARKNLNIDNEALVQIKEYWQLISDFLTFINDHLEESITKTDYISGKEMGQKIRNEHKKLKKGVRERLKSGGDVKSELIFSDIVEELAYVGECALNITGTLAPPPEEDISPASKGKNRPSFGSIECEENKASSIS